MRQGLLNKTLVKLKRIRKESLLGISVGGLLFFLLSNCNQSNRHDSSYVLSGEIKGINSGWIYVKHRQTNKLDSARIQNGRFTIKGEAGTPEFCNIGSGSVRRREFYFGFFLQAGEMKMTANKDSLYDAAVSFEGSPIQDEFKQFQIKMWPVDSLSNQIAMIIETSAKQDSLFKRLNELDKTRKDMIWRYSLEHPNSYVSAFEVASYFTEKEDLPRLDSIYHQMNPELKKWFYSEKINQHLQKNKADYKNDAVKI